MPKDSQMQSSLTQTPQPSSSSSSSSLLSAGAVPTDCWLCRGVPAALFIVCGEGTEPIVAGFEFAAASFLFGTGSRISKMRSKMSSGDSIEGAGEAI